MRVQCLRLARLAPTSPSLENPSPMRITVVSPQLPTPAFPMRGVHHFEQLRLFAEAGHSVHAVVPVAWAPWRHPPRQEIDAGNVLVSHPPYPRPPLGNVRHRSHRAAGLGAVLERILFARAAATDIQRPDVVLAHSATLPGGLFSRIEGALFVVTVHDNELYDSVPRSRLVRSMIARTLRRADCIVYQSDALRRHGLRIAGPHESRIIPIGIDVFPDLVAVPPSSFTICCVARLIPSKGIDKLVRVLSRLRESCPDARLVIVGEGPERGALEALANSLRLKEHVRFTGLLDRRAAQQEMARASVMAMPSAPESLGAVYFEAMSLGVPVIGTEGEGISEHVCHGVDGLLVPRDDEERLHVEVRRLASDQEYSTRIGQAGRARFLSRGPSWQANVAAYLALFDELRKRTRSGGSRQTTNDGFFA
jgi:glycosyltransferase involved in cell wall biosynthesis